MPPEELGGGEESSTSTSTSTSTSEQLTQPPPSSGAPLHQQGTQSSLIERTPEDNEMSERDTPSPPPAQHGATGPLAPTCSTRGHSDSACGAQSYGTPPWDRSQRDPCQGP
ncbi:unnamed protein product [Arctogadus glacialis]